MNKKLKKFILDFKKKAFKNKFNDSFGTKYFYIVGSIIVITLLVFMFLFNTYKDGLTVDNDGFFISNDSDVLSIKVDNDKKKELKTVGVNAYDTIYKTPLNVYYDSSKKHAINITYPLYSNEGLSLINYNDEINLINSKLVRSTGYANMIFSYGKAFDTYGGKQIDRNNYILLSYSNGLFINLYDIEITTLNDIYKIPVNSIINFNTDSIKYFELTDDKTFVSKEINGIDLDSVIKFYYDTIEEYEYNYEDLLEGIGSAYKKPEKIVIPDEPINPDEPHEEDDPSGEDPDNGDVHYEEPEFVYVKPTVKSGEFTANVYSMSGSIEVNDPSGVITKEPTYTLRVKGKTYLKRSFYGTSTFKITGLIPSTNYDIIGQYTYLDEDMETKKLVTFYSGTVSTKDLSSLSPIKIKHESLYKYPKKVEVNNIEITSDLDSEAINGVYKISIKIDGTDYYLSPADLQALLNGKKTDSSTSSSLASNSNFNYSINFYDRSNNLIPASNVNGSASTSKIPPSLSLKVASKDVDYVTIKVTLKNEDNVELINYRYEVYDQKGVVIKQDSLGNDDVVLRDLDPNQYYTFKAFANIDLNDDKGLVKNYEIGSMDFTTVPLTSLGMVNFNVKLLNVTHDKAVISLQINQRKTDARLIRLTKTLIFNLYDEDKNVVKTLDLSEDVLERLKEGEEVELTFNNLDSNTSYNFKMKSTSYQGTVSYEADCLTNIDSFDTTKVPARVLLTNSYTSNTLIDFDVQIIDVDNSIKSNFVRFELRDAAGNITNSSKLNINSSPVRMTFNNLSERKQYYAYFIADSYNETNKNETYKTKYLLTRDPDDNSVGKPIEFWTTNGISGNVELISSQRIANGNNLVDMKSNIKWIENTHSGTLHRTYDSNGHMHLRSRGSAAAYQYDLSEYMGKLVKVSFKIKAVNPLGYDIYLNNYITSSTSANYGYKLEGLSSNEFKTFEYTFMLGSYYHTAGKATNFLPNTGKSYGKPLTSTIGFYINGGSITPSDFEVADFQVYLYDEEEIEYTPEYEIGTWNGSKPIFANSSTTAKNKEPFVAPENGWYRFDFNNMDEMYRLYYRVYNMNETSVSVNIGYYNYPVTLYLQKNQKVGLIIQKAGGGLVPDIEEMNENLNLKVTRFYGNPNTSTYQDFTYDLVTRIRVNITDARNEINNVDKTTCPDCHNYYIRILNKDGEELKVIGYDDLQGLGSLKNAIKEIELSESREYQVELGFKIRDRYYYLDSFDISTKDEVAGVRDSDEFRWIQPYGNYVVLNDIDFADKTYYIGYEYNKFSGTVDFQGYTMTLNTYTVSALRKFYQTNSSSVLKNLVLDIHLNHNTGLSLEGFVTYNRGLIENVVINVYDERGQVTKDSRFVMLNYYTYQTGKIRNFVANLATPLELHDDASIINFYNRGDISYGYVYGNDINVGTELSSGDTTRIISLISYYGYVTSRVNNIYTLNSVYFPNDYDYDITGLIQRNTYGSVENVYVVGDTNPEKRSYGPIVAYLSASGTLKNGYYMSNNTYTSASHQKIFPLTLNSVEFQKDVLGEEHFNIEEMMEFGYYPHLIFSSTKMPNQPYIELPEADENEIDIVNSSIVSQTDTSARMLLTINNPHGEEITDVSVSDLDVVVDSQSFEDGNSYVYINVSNPMSFKSKYEIRSITSKYANKYETTRRYNEGDKYLFIDFYHQITSVEEWIGIKDDTTSNYSIAADLDFYGYNNYIISSFTGKIKENNHTLKNIYIDSNNRGLIVNMYGEISGLNIENFIKTSYATSYNGLFGTTNANTFIDDIHMKNVTIIIPDTATSEQLVGALVGYAVNAKISNCSATDVHITSKAEVTNIEVGGLIGRFNTSTMTNSYVQNVDIDISGALYSNGIGGVVGRNTQTEGMIENCYSTGKIVSSTTYVGGITGYTSGVVNNCYSTVSIISDMDQIAGISGYLIANSYMSRNLFLGKVFTDYSGGLIGRISSNIESDSDYPNFAYSGVTLNGKVSNETMGEKLISRDELKNREVYEEVISLGSDYDYSGVSEGILPKLYYNGTTNLLPNQLDNMLKDEGLNIEELIIDKHPSNATLRFTIDNPYQYEITNMEINDVSIDSVDSTNIENNKTIVTVNVTPLKYFDSYRLTKIYYMDNGIEESADKVYRIDMEFYKELRTIADWQNISKEYAENYRLVNDIDFTGVNPVNTEVLINKLETESGNINHSLKNMTISYTANGLYKGLIRKVVKQISNVDFENITITNTSTSSQNYTDLININFGLIEKCNFNNITINAPKKSYVAIIGRDEGKGLENLSLKDVNIAATSYVAGLTSYHINSTGVREIKNVELDNVNVTATSNYVGGIVATSAGSSLAEGIFDISYNTVNNSTIIGNNYVGGVGGYSDCSFCTVNNTTVTGATYVGGVLGYGFSVYLYEDRVIGSTIGGTKDVGGITGYGRYIRGAHVSDSHINGLTASTENVGGVVGRNETGYSMYRMGISNSTVTNNGNNTGGIIGKSIYPTIGYYYVNDSTINGENNVGGVVGHQKQTNEVYGIVGNVNVIANNSAAGGLIGYINNAERTSGYFYANVIEKATISSRSYSGGFYGKRDVTLNSLSSTYSNYFEGNVSSDDNITSGIIAGDFSDSDVINTRQLAVYENSTVNGEYIKDLYSTSTEQIIKIDSFEEGYVNSSTGEVYTNYNYYYASHSELIPTVKGKTYTINSYLKRTADGTRDSGGLTFFVIYYDENKKVLGTGSGANAYIDRYFSNSYIMNQSFRALKDGYVQFVLYNDTNIDYIDLTVTNNNFYNLSKKQVVKYDELRNRITWSDYYSSNNVSTYEVSKLSLNVNQFDFTPLNTSVNNLAVTDLSGKNHNGVAHVSGVTNKGFIFDGKNDYIDVSGYTGSKTFTIIATYMHANTSTSTLFYYGPSDITNKGYQFSPSTYEPYLTLNGTDYSTYGYQMVLTSGMVALHYDSTNKHIYNYINGELKYRRSLNNVPTTNDSYVTRIGMTSIDTRPFSGVLSNIMVYNRLLTAEEIRQIYYSSGAANTEGLELYYDLTKYENTSEAHYPLVKSNDSNYIMDYQKLVDLPTNPLFLSSSSTVNTGSAMLNTNVYKGSMEGKYHVYRSGIDTVNIEFDEVPKDLKFSYSYGKYKSKEISATDRVYTISYNYKDDLNINIKTTFESINKKFESKDLAKMISIIGNNYYYISKGSLYKNSDKVLDGALNIYDGLVLLKSNQLYNINTSKYQNYIHSYGVSSSKVPIYVSSIDESNIESYYNFSVISKEKEFNTRDYQMMAKDDILYIFSDNNGVNLVFNSYNTNSYQLGLKDGSIVSYKEDVFLGDNFYNGEIAEIDFDKNSNNPLIMIRYDDGNIMVINYYNGNTVFESREYIVSLFNYISRSMISSTGSANINTSSYKENNNIVISLNNIKNDEVKEKLGINTSEDTNASYKNNYTVYYNASSNKYEIMNTNNLIDTKVSTDEMVSENSKIESDTFLYNYFYNKVRKNVVTDNRIYIYIAIFIIVLINLILLGRKVLMRNEGNN